MFEVICIIIGSVIGCLIAMWQIKRKILSGDYDQ